MVTPNDSATDTAVVSTPPSERATPDNLHDALGLFVIEKKNLKNSKKSMDGHQEILRFIDWYGRDRKIHDLSPSLVEEYAREFSQRGADAQKRLVPVKEFFVFLRKKDWIEINLSVHLRASRSRRTGTGRQTTAADSQSSGPRLSQEGYERLVDELEKYKVEKVKADEEVREAMAGKDFRENAPLDAAKERQGFVAAKIRELESEVASAQILSGDVDTNSGKRVVVGSSITIKDVGSGKVINYTLVDKREADVKSGKISTVSPVGQALLDKTVGDTVEITVPRGIMSFLIEKIGA
ncbi:MAG: transcription elongation factor GreA [Chloroflexota bacterium]|nr:transcription elongation factor GreA [Chloroflexota bacterium]